MAAHRIPYQATASIAYPEDLYKKAVKAKNIRGTKFIHVLAPCPTGWKSRPEDAVKLARLAVQTSYFPLYEVEDGEKYTLNFKIQNKKSIDEYLKLQGRFRHLKPEAIAAIQAEVDPQLGPPFEKSDRPLNGKKRSRGPFRPPFFRPIKTGINRRPHCFPLGRPGSLAPARA